MRILLLDTNTQEEVPAFISKVQIRDIRFSELEWGFNWRELFATEGAVFFKISLLNTSHIVEGLLMLSTYFGEMVYMNNLEVAPHNFGKEKKYDRVAGCLLAYSCMYASKYGKGNYKGYLVFESKTELLPLYEQKYGAKRIGGLKMYLDPEAGRKLKKQYLDI